MANSEDKEKKCMKIFATIDNDDYQKLIKEFREEFNIERDYSDNFLFEILIKNKFNFEEAFISLIN